MATELIERLHAYYAAWSAGDPEAVLAFFTEDATFEDLAFEARFVGHEQIRSFVDLTYGGIPDFRIDPDQIVAGAGGAAASWTMSGTHAGDMPGFPATGRPFAVRAASVVTFADDRIARMTDFWNPLSFRRCVGLV